MLSMLKLLFTSNTNNIKENKTSKALYFFPDISLLLYQFLFMSALVLPKTFLY